MSTMTTPSSVARYWRAQRNVLVLCVPLVAYHLYRLAGVWAAWHSGQPDSYPGQHRTRLFGSVTGLALALAILLPGWLVAAREPSRRRLVAFRIMWRTLMFIAVAGMVLDVGSCAHDRFSSSAP